MEGEGGESNQQDSARIRCPPFVVSLTISFQLERERGHYQYQVGYPLIN